MWRAANVARMCATANVFESECITNARECASRACAEMRRFADVHEMHENVREVADTFCTDHIRHEPHSTTDSLLVHSNRIRTNHIPVKNSMYANALGCAWRWSVVECGRRGNVLDRNVKECGPAECTRMFPNVLGEVHRMYVVMNACACTQCMWQNVLTERMYVGQKR